MAALPNGEPIPHGWSAVSREEACTDNRSRWIVENEDEVRLLFKGTEHPQRQFRCGYCSNGYRTRDERKAVEWFHQHECRTLEAAEAAALVVSLTQLAAEDNRLAA